ncbi:hypothetical protein A3H09_03550 [Candidatus Falkowbacteria bacterium RIFCSPLOWO2_12_FULL_45_13]|uniref:Glycosyl transferase family 1 domain-containing protein n=2 Tax=Candidatus Falkowiibacteriota TaxID=1752728 RepID=A0A1F5SBG1_9BACT|nr:MAG: hypothetical protein A3H66_00830 [Candidatus Falkowbacteria bacterium RIFCSPLOWO2_02_FULL_45_21]OGF31971.1 MAG: hypothetical protein A3H09_03550 [Candidatus Falkowbacteria bacterium RIFCSPLOWO2_12_FULL_45_13]
MKRQNIKRIGIDARFYGPLGKGLGRYTRQIVDQITGLDDSHEYVIFLGRENFDDFKTSNPRVKKVLADIGWYGLAEQILFPFYIWWARLDLMHFPHFNVPVFCPIKFLVTIHDLILIKFPTRRATTLGPIIYAIKNFFYKIVIWRAVKRSRRVIAVSVYTKKDIIERFKINPKKVTVTYEGVADFFRHSGAIDPSGRLLKYGLAKPYLLYVGNAYPHKNLESLIKAFSLIGQRLKDLSLVLVGKEDYFYSRLKKTAQGINARIVFPGYVPDSDLKIIYAQALAYVFPSFYEGFGLPALEAMSFGLPVISSDRTCLPEILGQAAVFFNPADQADMKEKIEMVIKDEKLRLEIAERGYRQVKKYSWSDCVRKTLEVYNEVLNK